MIRDIIGSAFRRNNPWWEGLPLDRLGGESVPSSARNSALGRYHNIDRFARSDFEYQYDSVLENRLHVLAAPNGIGKTFTLCRIASRFGEMDMIPGENLFYLPCAKPIFRIGTDVPILDATDWYFQHVHDSFQRQLSEFPTDETEPSGEGTATDVYLFADDVHLLDDWSEQAAEVLEAYPELNIVATTPSGAALDRNPFENRDITVGSDILLHRKFHDWSTSGGDQRSIIRDDDNGFENSTAIKTSCRAVRDGLATFATSGDVDIEAELYELIEQVGFEPEQAEHTVTRYIHGVDRLQPSRDIDRDIDITIYRDVPQIQSIGSPAELNVLLSIAAVEAGQTHSMKDWSSMLDIDRRTLDRYLDLLAQFYLVTSSGHHTHEVRRALRLYPRNPSHILALTDGGGITSAQAANRLLMSVLFDHCKRLSYYFTHEDESVEYWESNGEVVDFVVPTGVDNEASLPITFSAPGDVEAAVGSMRSFLDADETDTDAGGVILTWGDRNPATEINLRDDVLIMPTWLFLFSV